MDSKIRLDKGSFATAYSVQNKRTRETVAVKISDTNAAALADIRIEKNAMEQFANLQHVIQFIGYEEKSNIGYLFIELAHGYNLRLFTNSGSSFKPSLQLRKRIAREVCLGLDEIHQMNLAHLDVHAKNALIIPHHEAGKELETYPPNKAMVKITDFGKVRRLDQNTLREDIFQLQQLLAHVIFSKVQEVDEALTRFEQCVAMHPLGPNCASIQRVFENFRELF